MKKLFLFLALITVATSVSGAEWIKPGTKTVAQLKGSQSWSGGSKVTNIAVDNVITIDYGKYYTDEGGQLRYYYQDNTEASKFTISAKEGYIIHTVNFKYSKGNSNVVLSDVYCYGSNVPDGHAFESETTYVVDAISKTFRNSVKSKSSSGGNLNVLNVTVTYIALASPDLQFAEASKTVCKNAAAFVNPLQNKGNGAVTYESSNTSVATVSGDGTITVKGVVGDATITATTAATSLYKAESKSFDLTVSPNLTPSSLAPVEYTETKVVNDFKVQDGNNWADASVHLEVNLNNAIKLLGTSGNQKYVSSKAFRFYQTSNKGQFTMQGKTGVIIKNVAFLYGSNTNTILGKRYYGSSGQELPEGDQILSEKTYNVNANTVTYYAGNPNASNGHSADIEKYTAVYIDPTVVLEQFTAYTGGTSTQKIVGDNGIYKWRVTAQNHSEKFDPYTAIKLQYEDTLAFDSIMEGGIKTISFDWRTTGGNYPNHFFVKAGSFTDEISIASFNNTSRILTYSHDFKIESNTTLAIYNPTQETLQQNHIAVGPVHITPYLLFNVPNHAATFNIEDGTACDLNSALINNTNGGTITFDVIENTAGGNPSITDGILDFSSVVRTGTIKVQASWSGVTTTLTLTINLKNPQISFAKEKDTVMLSQEPYKRELNKGLSSGVVTYSFVSAPQGASINPSTGDVTLSTAGEYKVKGKIAASLPYAEDSATYTLTVTSLPIPTITFDDEVVNKTMPFIPFTNKLYTESSGKRHFSSSDIRVASVDSTGLVTMGEKPGTTTISVTIDSTISYATGNAQYTLNVSAAPVVDIHKVNTTVEQIKGTAVWPTGSDNERARYNVKIDDVITLSYGKYYCENNVHKFRYYYQNNTQASKFTIQAKAGVIIQSIKLTYEAGANGVLSNALCYGSDAPEANRFISGITYPVDANSITFYNSKTSGDAGGNINVTGYEITYFKPATGVAVTKSAADLGKDLALVSDQCYQNIAINQAITMHADDASTMRYKGSGFDCYRHKGAIDIIARPGATIHYVKITYSSANGTDNFVLTKYFGSDGFNIPAIDHIASDSILYVNANSLKLYIGTPQESAGWSGVRISKIYVNYTDNSEVVVDNFNNCKDLGSESFVNVAGVDGKYNWTITNFSRGNADRMYYDQSIKLNKGGKISTQYTGGLQEAAFNWHPTANARVKFAVVTGADTCRIDSAAKGGIYTFNFQKTAIKTNGEFAIIADSAVEFGHISLTPYLLYTCKDTTIAAKDYKTAGWKFTSPSLINYTGQGVTYSVSGENADKIASIDANGVVTILSGGTVNVNATADGAMASYQLTINLENTAVEFENDTVTTLLSVETHKQTLKIVTAPDTGRVVSYSIVGSPAGASVNSNGLVTFTATGKYTVKGRLEQNLPFAAAEATYLLEVNNAPKPNISYDVDSLVKDINDEDFINPLNAPVGVGTATYTSSDKNVATVAGDGTVTIKGAGQTIIKVVVAESPSYTTDSASYKLTVLPLPVITFANSDTTVYLNTTTFTNTINIPQGAGAVAYTSSNDKVASVNSTSGLVTRGNAGDAVISVTTERTDIYSAGSASYNVHVVTKYFTTASFEHPTITKKQNDAPFKNKLNINPSSDGQVSYTSSNTQVATVASDGTVTMQGKLGEAIITANVAATATYLATSASFTLTVQGAPAEDEKVANGNVAQIASDLNWPTPADDETACKPYIKLDDVIATYTPVVGNAKYYKSGEEKSLRYYQGSNKGQFIIRAKAGAIIQSIKLTYVQVGTGVVATNYGANNDGKNIVEADRLISGVAKKFDANSVTLYVGSTGNESGQQVRITDFEVKYFDPSQGVAVTKSAADLGKDLGLISNLQDGYHDIQVNNVISLHADTKGTLKYYSDANGTTINCYRWTGPIDIKAREGATIHYVKITYTHADQNKDYTGVLTKYFGTDGKGIPASDCIASDSILHVNANSLRLYVGSNGAGDGRIFISKIYVNYTDNSEAIVETFEKCEVANSVKSTNVDGIDNTYKWKLTNYNMDSTHHIYYDQSIMLRTDKESKIETLGEEGGFKEISFDWFVNTPSKRSKFTVQAGNMTDVVDSAAMGSNYKITYTKTGIKSNGAFSISMATGSDTYTYAEFGHISLTPYLLYTTKAGNLSLTDTKTFQMTPQIDNRDDKNSSSVSYSFVEDDVTFATIDPVSGLVTATDSGLVTVKAAWSTHPEVYTTYTLTIGPNAVVVKDENAYASNLPVGANVTILDGANLIINDHSLFGNIRVKEGAIVTIPNQVNLTINDFVIESTMAGGKSGQVKGSTDNLHIEGDAYFELKLGDNANPEKWHAFAVPFPVDALNGIFDATGNKLANEVNYAIMDYHGDVRAQGKYGWSKYRGILQPGVFYIMTVDGETKTFRMKMSGDFQTASKNVPVFEYASSTGKNDNGWNGISNNQLAYVSIGKNVQVLDPESYTYVAKPANNFDFTVGTPFFYQSEADGSVELLAAQGGTPYAPSRMTSAELKNVDITLANAQFTDHLYVSSTEDATNDYQIGRDLAKMSMTSTPAVPQIFGQAYDTKLCMIDLPMANDQVSYSVLLYAPKAGEYTIAVAQVEGYEVFLTKDGAAIWNLTMGAATLELAKGNTNGYGIVIKKAPQVTTDIENVFGNGDDTQKFIYNDVLYIIRDGVRYNANGQMLK